MLGTTTLLITNLPANCQEEPLRLWFESHKLHASSVTLIRDVVSGTSPSFAHVTFADETKLEAAMEMLGGKVFGGKTVSVQRLTAHAAGKAMK